MSENAPVVTVIKSFAPESSRAAMPTLSYKNLGAAATKHATYDSYRWSALEATESEIEEQVTAEQLASQYLVQTAENLCRAGSEASKLIWSNRFTEASIELYGQPDPGIAKRLLLDQRNEFADLDGNPKVSQQQLEFLLRKYDMLNLFSEGSENDQRKMVNEASSYLMDMITNRYPDTLAVFTQLPPDGSSNPEEIATLFNKGFAALRSQNDDWKDWEAVLAEGTNLSRVKKNIKVGRDRVSAKNCELTGLFSHEVLVHGLRVVNGSEFPTTRLKTGLPNYLPAEEGIAGLVEYGFTGKMPNKVTDRYTDISLALGQITGEPIPRKDLFLLAAARSIIRMQAERTDGEMQQDTKGVMQTKKATEVQTAALHHVNRIYRGSLGNHHVGVFTKDIAYYQGLNPMAKYIATELQKGKDPSRLFDYIMQGKFDPTNAVHAEYVAKSTGSGA